MRTLRIFFVCVLAFLPVIASAKDTAQTTISVKVRDTVLRAKPKAWAPGVSSLSYGDKLSVIGSEEGWFKVKAASGKEGYLHPAVVTDRVVVLKSAKGAPSKEVDPSEVVLAGKGFSREIEKQYASQNPTLKYGELNQIEKLRVADSDLLDFMRQGMLGKGRL